MINIERVISKTPMVIADYFTEDGLLKQVGLVKEYWNRIVVKELTDNALDAIEPLQDKKVFMDVTSGSLGIYDNGTGIKKETVEDIYILDSFATPNKKFKNIIYMENLGVTIEDIRKYNIEPEKVEIKKEDRSKLENLSYEYQQFFNAGTHYRRVELNAFTTAQILEIIDEKLSRVQNLPTVNLETSLNIDHKAIKETAFMRIMSDKYTDELSKINVPIDLSQYKGRYTLETAKKEIPEIEEDLILLYEQEIEKKLNIS